jgi:hypothetical protein
MTYELESLSTPELLQLYSRILDELRARKVVRTSNSPVGDYTEWLVANKLGLTLVKNSTSGHDAVDAFGMKFQIKGRRITSHNQSRQLSAIRNLESHDFDYLIAVLFNEQMKVLQVVKIPHEIIEKYARFSNHVHAHLLILRQNILNDPMVEDITVVFHH